jgi:hypothetical protein
MRQRRFTGVTIGRSSFPLLIVLLTLTLSCGRLWAQTDPFVGTWSQVIGPGPSGEIHIAMENGQLRMGVTFTFKDGRLGTQDNIVQFDGKERPMNSTGDTKHRKHAVAWKRIDDHTIEQQINHDDGKEHSKERYVVSPNGKGLTLTIVVQQPDGTWHQTGFATFARQ